jgi:hypothetical protein
MRILKPTMPNLKHKAPIVLVGSSLDPANFLRHFPKADPTLCFLQAFGKKLKFPYNYLVHFLNLFTVKPAFLTPLQMILAVLKNQLARLDDFRKACLNGIILMWALYVIMQLECMGVIKYIMCLIYILLATMYAMRMNGPA